MLPERGLANILDQIRDAFWVLDRDWRFQYLNAPTAEYAGATIEALRGQSFWQAFPHLRDSMWREQLELAAGQGQAVEFEGWDPKTQQWFEVRVFPSPMGLTVYAHDVTLRKQAQAAYQRLAAIMETTSDLVWMASPEGRLLYVNQAARKCLQIGPDTDLGSITLEQRYTPWAARLVAEVGIPTACREGLWHGETAVRRPEGRELPVSQIILAHKGPDGRVEYLSTLCRDLSTHRQIESLRDSESRFRALIENSWDAFSVVDADARVRYCSPSIHRVLGYTVEEFLGRSALEGVHPDDAAGVRRALTRCLAEARATGKAEFRYRHKDGHYRWIEATGTSLLADPMVGGVVVNYRDTTERHRVETELKALTQTLEERVALRTAEAEHRARQLRALATELTQTEQRERRRMATLLHDHLQQILAAAKMRTSIVQMHLPTSAVREELARVVDLLTQAIQESRAVTGELSPPVLYDGGLGAALEWLARWKQQKHGLRVTVQADPKAEPPTEDLRAFLFHAVRELLRNVVEHAGASEADVTLHRPEPGVLQIEVADRGCGFEPACLTTPGLSGGFGLFSLRERLEALGGRLEVHSTPGQGTRVTLTMPLLTAAAAPQAAPAANGGQERAQPAPHSSIRVLLVDDHKLVRESLAGMLQSQPDIEVIGQAADGLLALEFLQTQRPDVIVMDITMPRLNGIEAAREIAARWPGVQIIGLSMHEDEHMVARMLQAGAVAFLNKGGPLDALVGTIRNCAAIRPAPLP